MHLSYTQCRAPRYAMPHPTQSLVTTTVISYTSHVQSSSKRPHLLEMPNDGHVRIHVSIHAIHHARLFAPVELAGRDLRCDAPMSSRISINQDGFYLTDTKG